MEAPKPFFGSETGRYNLNGDENDMNLPADKEYIGLIAQAAREVIPEAVEEGENGYLMVNDSAINNTMINAIKELEAKVDFLKRRINKLEKGR